MTPDDLDLVQDDARQLSDRGDALADRFYDTLFDLRPDLRALFSDDLDEQRSKLIRELDLLIAAALAWRTTGSLADFVTRAHALGARHVDYDVDAAMYEPVGQALLAALRETLDDFDESHVAAWSTLYRVVADTMREGALRSS